ncbi:hypothetical protein [Martelella mangrovi]|uniref:Uncharacterized protein n=1 Tax=Martelella mangrovi TaxID=1397477 RepID=A0ABV2ICL2_9HYPH
MMDLWGFVASLDHSSVMTLFTHCALLTVDADKQPREAEKRHALNATDRLATAVSLDMTAHRTPTVRAYLGRVTKAHILAAARDVFGGEADRGLEEAGNGRSHRATFGRNRLAAARAAFWRAGMAGRRAAGGYNARGHAGSCEHRGFICRGGMKNGPGMHKGSRSSIGKIAVARLLRAAG